MAEETNVEFTLGEHWPFEVDLNDADGENLDLTGATITFRVTSRRGTVLIDTADVTISTPEPTGGTGIVTVPPDAQGECPAGVHDYELRVTLGTGIVTTQAHGSLTAHPSLF